MGANLDRFVARSGLHRVFAPWRRDHAPIVMLHRFVDGAGKDGRTQVAHLAGCLEFLRSEGYRVCTLAQLAGEFGAKRWDGRTVVFTVDDGYEDFARLAAPLFLDHGMRCTLFVTTGLVGAGGWNWWDRIEAAFAGSTRGPSDPPVAARLAAAFPAATPHHVQGVVEACKELPTDERRLFIAGLEEDLEVALPDLPPPHYRGMDWAAARRLAEQGFELGAHTVSHPILSRVSDDEAIREALDSIETLERETGVRPTTFCYPNGRLRDIPAALLPALREAGIVAAVTTEEGILTRAALADGDRPLLLPRVSLPRSRERFVSLVSGVEALKQRVRA